MRGARFSLRIVASFVLAMQLAVPAMASAALCCKDPAALAGKTDELMECCKKGGVHICPMRKPSDARTSLARATQSADDADQLRACCLPDTKILAALLGTTSLSAVEPFALAQPVIVRADSQARQDSLRWTPRSTSPPPKA